MPRSSGRPYKHLERVKWPQDLPDPSYWIPGSNVVGDLPKGLKQWVTPVTISGVRFWQKANGLLAPCLPGEKTDPDAIHALQIALDRQDELETEIEAVSEHQTERLVPLILWLQERKKSHVTSMQAVVMAEEGEFFEKANEEAWEVEPAKMTNEQVEQLRFIFRTVMARVDIAPAEESDVEFVQSTVKETILQVDKLSKNDFVPAPSASFWKDDSLIEKSNMEMRYEALALYHQGRVLSACWAFVTGNIIYPARMTEITRRALHLTMRSIDLMWINRLQELPEEEEKRLLAWLCEKKNTAVEIRIGLIAKQLPVEWRHCPVKIDSSGMVFEMVEGEFLELGRMDAGPYGTL